MEALTPVELTVDLPSLQRADHMHAVGTVGVVIGRVGLDQLLVKLEVPDPELVGTAWQEEMAVYEHEVRVIEVI